MAKRTQHEGANFLMETEILYLYIRTKKDEELKLDEVSSLFIGSYSYNPRDFSKDVKSFLVISSTKGEMKFDLDEVVDLSFCLQTREKKQFIQIGSEEREWNEVVDE